MSETFQAVIQWFRRRGRRRQWRYVSARRRWVGMLLLALLLTVTYGYWALTNDARIRRVSQRYLSALTGAQVKVEGAEFSLFGPIRLRNVRVFFEGAKTGYPFFQARAVTLRHNPWSILTRGKVDAIDLVCTGSIVTVEVVESDGGRSDQGQMRFPRGRTLLPDQSLPAIRLPQATIRTVYVPGAAPGPDHVSVSKPKDLLVNVAMLPEGPEAYGILVEVVDRDGHSQPIHGKIVLNLASGEHTLSGEAASLLGLRPALPKKYDDWLAKYDLRGGGFKIDGRIGPDQPEGGMLRVTLTNLSMRLPDEEGGLRLVDVHGTIEFRQDKVILKGIAGCPHGAKGTKIALDGTYAGYEPTSDFVMNVAVEKLQLPSDLGLKGDLGNAMAWLRRECTPKGDISLQLRYERTGGKFRLDGTARPGTLEATYRWFPYRLTDLTGEIRLSLTQARLVNLRGRRGEARFVINGTTSMLDPSYDITVRGEPGQLHAELRDALPKEYAEIWRTVNPSGWIEAEVHAYRGPADRKGRVGLKLMMKGRAAMKYRHFPYPLSNITGSVLLEGDTIRLDQIEGWRGKTRCVVNGTISGLYTPKPAMDVVVDATDVPLDEALRSAMDPDARAMLDSLHATGLAKRISVSLHQTPGQEVEHSIRVWPDQVRIKPEGFPYEIHDVHGVLTLTPGVAEIKELHGTRGSATIDLDGSVYLRGRKLGLDLDVRGSGIAFDDGLAAALPPAARKVWRDLAPSGLADVRLQLQSHVPDKPGQDRYTLTIRPKGMAVRHALFPYPLRNLAGESIVITPEQVTLTGLTFGKAPMSARLSGTIRLADDGTQRVDLALDARAVPVDEPLIRALPEALAPLTQAMRKGGTCELNFKRLAFTSGAAVTDVEIDARVGLDRAVFGGREFTRLEGRILKAPASSLIRIQDIAARVYGGKVSGFGRIKMGPAGEYGLSVYLEDVNVPALVNAGIQAPRKRTDMQGLLTGDIKITGQFDKPQTRQGVGVFHVRKAKIYKLPVLLGALQVVFLSLPGQTAFTSGDVRYQIRGEKLVFREIFLSGPTLSMVGSGTMSLKTQRLAITFLTGKPGKMPRMENLLTVADQVLRFLAKELMQIEVSGTLKKPVMRTVPLRSLDTAIRRLLAPDQPSP